MSKRFEQISRRTVIAASVTLLAGCNGKAPDSTPTAEPSTSKKSQQTEPAGPYEATFEVDSPCDRVVVTVVHVEENRTVGEGEAPLDVVLVPEEKYLVKADAGHEQRDIAVFKAHGRETLTVKSDRWWCGDE